MTTLVKKGFQISKNVLFSTLTQKAARLLGKPGKIALLLHEAYQKLTAAEGQKSGFAKIKETMFTFIRLVRSFTRGRYRQVSRKSIIIGVATLLYLVLPIDLIPDFIPALGLMDDLSLMAWFIQAFQEELGKYKEWESHQLLPA
jgi:uncharacterized membrane protein YkvA (DUF1232 family)